MLKTVGLDGVFAAVGNLYLLAALICICMALWRGRTWVRKFVFAVIVLGFFIAPIAPDIYKTFEYRSKLSKAQTLFDKRCKTAGEKIYKSVENVDGVFLLTLKKRASLEDQFELNEQAGDRAHDVGYVQSFFMSKEDDFYLTANKKGGYQFVEADDARNQSLVRFTDERKATTESALGQLSLVKIAIKKRTAAYGVSSEDISTQQDRENWIAGSRIKIVSLDSGALIAERIGYMLDNGLGNKNGGRSPWAFAAYSACPAFPRLHGQYPYQWGLTRNFVEKVLSPISFKEQK